MKTKSASEMLKTAMIKALCHLTYFGTVSAGAIGLCYLGEKAFGEEKIKNALPAIVGAFIINPDSNG